MMEIDLNSLLPLTEKQKAELTALFARPDSEIDYGDQPRLTEAFWKSAVHRRRRGSRVFLKTGPLA